MTLEVKSPTYYPPPCHHSNSQKIKDTMARRWFKSALLMDGSMHLKSEAKWSFFLSEVMTAKPSWLAHKFIHPVRERERLECGELVLDGSTMCRSCWVCLWHRDWKSKIRSKIDRKREKSRRISKKEPSAYYLPQVEKSTQRCSCPINYNYPWRHTTCKSISPVLAH